MTHHQEEVPTWPTVAVIGAGLLAAIGLMVLWATHVILCIKTSAWVLLVIGLIVPPVGWVHGFAYWAGLL